MAGSPRAIRKRDWPDWIFQTPPIVGDEVTSLKFLRLLGLQIETPHVVSYKLKFAAGIA